MASNGRLPDSALAPIPGGRLSKPAARAWNAMCNYIHNEHKAIPMPNGPDSSYRTFARQVFWKAWWTARGKPGNAATPGTSNHGLGLAVDTNQSALVNQYGAAFGFQKRWSDAPGEAWHIKYSAEHASPKLIEHWLAKGPYGNPERKKGDVIKLGDHGKGVKSMQRYLTRRGFKTEADGVAGPNTIKNLKKFQKSVHLLADGVCGKQTWALLMHPKKKPTPTPAPQAKPTRISKKGINLITKFEGLVLKAYKPVKQEKYYTIGYGHYGPDVRADMTITKARALQLLAADLKGSEGAVLRHVKVPLTQNQFDALVSFVYNCGEGNFTSSTLLRKLNAKDYKGASKEFKKWIHGAGGVTLLGLVRRRLAEARLFRKK